LGAAAGGPLARTMGAVGEGRPALGTGSGEDAGVLAATATLQRLTPQISCRAGSNRGIDLTKPHPEFHFIGHRSGEGRVSRFSKG
jgi:hypothetical protein